jgi:hypothetical protein
MFVLVSWRGVCGREREGWGEGGREREGGEGGRERRRDRVSK